MNWLNRFQTNVVYLIKQIGSNQKLPPDGSLVEEMFDSDRRASQLHRVVGRISGRVTCTICYYLYLYLYYLYYLHNALLTFARLAHSMQYLPLHSLYYLQYLPLLDTLLVSLALQVHQVVVRISGSYHAEHHPQEKKK